MHVDLNKIISLKKFLRILHNEGIRKYEDSPYYTSGLREATSNCHDWMTSNDDDDYVINSILTWHSCVLKIKGHYYPVIIKNVPVGTSYNIPIDWPSNNSKDSCLNEIISRKIVAEDNEILVNDYFLNKLICDGVILKESMHNRVASKWYNRDFANIHNDVEVIPLSFDLYTYLEYNGNNDVALDDTIIDIYTIFDNIDIIMENNYHTWFKIGSTTLFAYERNNVKFSNISIHIGKMISLGEFNIVYKTYEDIDKEIREKIEEKKIEKKTNEANIEKKIEKKTNEDMSSFEANIEISIMSSYEANIEKKKETDDFEFLI